MNAVVFIQGAVAMGCIVAGIFFLRFWRQSQDRLFVHFAFAFWLLAIAYMLLALVAFATDQRLYVFVVRLLAFCIILYAIFEKNRRAP
jgi:hypothetical protein